MGQERKRRARERRERAQERREEFRRHDKAAEVDSGAAYRRTVQMPSVLAALREAVEPVSFCGHELERLYGRPLTGHLTYHALVARGASASVHTVALTPHIRKQLWEGAVPPGSRLVAKSFQNDRLSFLVNEAFAWAEASAPRPDPDSPGSPGRRHPNVLEFLGWFRERSGSSSWAGSSGAGKQPPPQQQQHATGTFCLLSPLADATLWARVHERTEGYSPQEAQQWLAGIASAVVYLHGMDLVHRDIKVANVVLFRDVAKLADFGLAFRQVGGRVSNADGRLGVGTQRYMAPELRDRSFTGDLRSADVYALAMVIFEVASRRAPFESLADADLVRAMRSGQHPHSTTPILPPGSELRRRLEESWSLDWAARPSAAQLLAALEAPSTAASLTIGRHRAEMARVVQRAIDLLGPDPYAATAGPDLGGTDEDPSDGEGEAGCAGARSGEGEGADADADAPFLLAWDPFLARDDRVAS